MKKLAILILFLLPFSSYASLLIGSKKVYVGRFIQGITIEHVFSIKNTGSLPVTIKKIIPD